MFPPKEHTLKTVKVEELTDEELCETADYVIDCLRLEAEKQAASSPKQSQNGRKSAMIWKWKRQYGGDWPKENDVRESTEIPGHAGADPDSGGV